MGPQDQKVALEPDELRKIRDACTNDPNRARGARDWALIAFGFAGAFRRSEIVARNIADLDFVNEELRVYLDRSKTDQFGRGSYITIKPAKDDRLCPVRAVQAWLALTTGPGPLFRRITKHGRALPCRLSATSVTAIAKGFGVVLDLPDDRLGAHSLRRDGDGAPGGGDRGDPHDGAQPPQEPRHAAALLPPTPTDGELYGAGGPMSRYPVSSAGTLAVSELPSGARAYAELPYSSVTEKSRQYHLRSYERWCAEHDTRPWPPTLTSLLVYAADRAQSKAYFTVREHVRNVCLLERKRSGTDLYAHPALHKLLEGIKRERPPAPVLPLRAAQVEQLFAYAPKTATQRTIRCILLLSYGAGLTLAISAGPKTWSSEGVSGLEMGGSSKKFQEPEDFPRSKMFVSKAI